ncbi:MAG: hypothetical protein RBS77_01820 [Candidatus Moranbacteria bacterium]|jgi:hypothetical protein|nr:hypothetical protein [Candidatus Moranbacteria bacterium]
MGDPINIVNIINDIASNPWIASVFGAIVGSLFGYYLGKLNWKKQFLLNHFDLHEKVLNKLNSIFEDEIEGYFFSKTNKEIKIWSKDSRIMSASEYFFELKKDEIFDEMSGIYPSYLAFGSIKDVMGELKHLSSRSNNKISKITENILSIWSNETKQLDDEINDLADSFNKDLEGWDISKEESKYLDYLQREREELILLKIVPMINSLAVELKKYLKNKE